MSIIKSVQYALARLNINRHAALTLWRSPWPHG